MNIFDVAPIPGLAESYTRTMVFTAGLPAEVVAAVDNAAVDASRDAECPRCRAQVEVCVCPPPCRVCGSGHVSVSWSRGFGAGYVVHAECLDCGASDTDDRSYPEA